MAKSYKVVAEYFLCKAYEAGDFLSNLRLQKLLYYAQAWHLALFDKPLFPGKFQAWVHGPVLPEAYREFKVFGWQPIVLDSIGDDQLKRIEAELSNDERALLKRVCEFYMVLSAYQLEKRVHLEKPWIEARKGISADTPSHAVITDGTMKEYYKGLSANA